jgi:hypothetical protein
MRDVVVEHGRPFPCMCTRVGRGYVLLVYHCVYVCMYVLSSPVRQTSSWREGERGMRKAGNGCEMGKLAGGRYAHLHAMRPGEEGAQIPANDD